MLSRPTVIEIVRVLWWFIAVVWLIGRFNTKRTAVGQSSASRVAYFSLLILSLLLLFAWIPGIDLRLVHDQLDPEGLALLALGVAIAVWSRATLARNWSGAITLKEDHELVTRGPYRFVRHPMYTGLLLMVVGTALVSGTLEAGVGVVIFLGIHLWKLRAEENLLLRHFPDSYPAYKARTKALIPYVL